MASKAVGKPPASRPVIYWDTCVFLAWIKAEIREAGQLAGAEVVADSVFRNEVILITSVITKAEISLVHKLNPGQLDKFNKLFGRSNIQLVDVTHPIAMKAGELRGFYTSPKLAFQDAIHLATAIVYRASAFHTFDGLKSAVVTKPKEQQLTLLPLNGNVAGHPLKIETPQAMQIGFELRPR